MSCSNAEPLNRPQYEVLESITRSLHLKQAQFSHGKQKLMSHKIQTRNAKVNGKVNTKVLWFAPTKPMNQSNMYGNVSFTLDWSRALDHLGPYLYYIDQKKTSDIMYTRVLLTNKCHSDLTPVNTNDSRMPLYKLGGKYHVATASDGVKHVLEVGIEADARRGKWLYANCMIQANDHSSANKRQYAGGPYNSCICHRFNHFKKVCPSPYTAQQTRAMITKLCPTMLRYMPSWNLDQFVVESNFFEGDDENDYEDGNFICDYDDHENVTFQISSRKIVTLCPDSDDGGEGSSYCHGPVVLTRDDSSDDESYGNARASRFQQPATRHDQDDGWSTGTKVALVAGGLALFAGLAAAFSADSGAEDKKKKTGGSGNN